MDHRKERIRLKIIGIVQGVGFRPFIFNLAKAHGLTGFVRNDGNGVTIEVQGEHNSLQAFACDITIKAPAAAFIKAISQEQLALMDGEKEFEIVHSEHSGNENKYISPDLAVCEDCKREITDPYERRFGYPFTNCTNCGPRFTIITEMPYDRPFTTMSGFTMCERCKVEYENPTDRRFHAQPICCPDCGPQITLTDHKGAQLPFSFALVQELIGSGKIIAVKGIGGFHFICDAKNEQAVLRLRERKQRDKRPFALMAKDVDAIKRFCHVSDKEEKLLCSAASPIVLLTKKTDCLSYISETDTLGFMLPYTPLHVLLLGGGVDVIVATSANISGEAIVHTNEAAISQLASVADYFILHNRDIHIAVEDSVTSVYNEKEYIIRRGRGYAPYPMDLSFLGKCSESVLAFGAELKNTFCLTKDSKAFVSGYIGDLKHLSVSQSLENGVAHYTRIFDIQPKIAAYDKHPDYTSTRLALESGTRRQIGVQHHHAHIASCMAENKINEKVIGIAFDGTGYGDDGAIWGGEFLVCDYESYTRPFHFEYIKVPGGDLCMDGPWRMKNAYLYQYGLFEPKTEREHLLYRQLEKGINCPQTSSVGRLFDAVSSLLGLCDYADYEAQAAILLQNTCDSSAQGEYRFEINCGNICLGKLFEDIQPQMEANVPIAAIAMRFHRTIASIVKEVCMKVRETSGINKVCFSGGVFQNLLLLGLCDQTLTQGGFEVFTHSKIPTNDSGISLGQAVIGAVREGK